MSTDFEYGIYEGQPLTPHPLADMLPLIDGDEFDRLCDDIRDHGLREPIVIVCEAGRWLIADGRNRARACAAEAITPRYKVFDPECDGDMRAFIMSTNIHRRHLSAEAKREVARNLLVADPSASDRAIARMVGCDHKTVGKVRDALSKDLTELSATWRRLAPWQRREFVAENRGTLSAIFLDLVEGDAGGRGFSPGTISAVT